MPAVCGRDVTVARRSKPAKIEPVVTSKCTSGRPLLTESAPQTEFRATHSKQTTHKFLTGARTHIRIFEFWPFTRQNLGQLIQRNPCPTNPQGSTRGRSSNRNWLRNRSSRKQAIRPPLTETRISRLGPGNRISTRFWPKCRKRRNLLKTNARQISTRGHNRTQRILRPAEGAGLRMTPLVGSSIRFFRYGLGCISVLVRAGETEISYGKNSPKNDPY